jgi:hypothetical protein
MRSHREVSTNTIMRQEALIIETKTDSKIIIKRQTKQPTIMMILIIRELPVAVIKINMVKSQKIIRKKTIANLLVQILIINSKR